MLQHSLLIVCSHGAGGRDAAGLLPLLQCLVKFLVDPRYSRLLLGVAHRVLDTYSGQVRSPALSALVHAKVRLPQCDLPMMAAVFGG